MYSMAPKQMTTPGAQIFGRMPPDAEAHPMARGPVPVDKFGGDGGFMGTMSPNGMSWGQYCQGQQILIDPSSGHLWVRGANAWLGQKCLRFAIQRGRTIPVTKRKGH